MEFAVYILYSHKYRTTYTGFTSDLITRFKFHNELSAKGHTIKFRPWEVIHVELYYDERKAIYQENI